MSRFTINISPDIPVPKDSANPIDIENIELENFNWGPVRRGIRTRYMLSYLIDGEEISYGVSNIVEILYDLFIEYQNLSGNLNHSVTICGYPVMDLVYVDNKISFRDTGDNHEDIANNIEIDCVRQQLVSKIQGVWFFVLPYLSLKSGRT